MSQMLSDAVEPNPVRNRILVAIIDPNPQEREQFSKALAGVYHVLSYPDFETAFNVLSLLPPSVLLLDHKVTTRSGMPLIQAVKAMPMFKNVPVILCKNADDEPFSTSPFHPDAVLEKPFLRSILLHTIGTVLDDEIEARWANLPLNTRISLQMTMKTFNHIAALVEQGGALPQIEIDNACAPLVDAVLNSEYRHLMQGVVGHGNFAYVHSIRVSALLVMMGYALGLHEAALRVLAVAGFVLDIGKMVIPDNVLNKIGPLSPAELNLCRNHAEFGIKYLQRHSNVPKGVMTVVSLHHERLDGSGYPLHLKGDELNELARIAAIVDVFAAMTESRPYKPIQTADQALDWMSAHMIGQLDMHLLDVFRSMLLDVSFTAIRDAPVAIQTQAIPS